MSKLQLGLTISLTKNEDLVHWNKTCFLQVLQATINPKLDKFPSIQSDFFFEKNICL